MLAILNVGFLVAAIGVMSRLATGPDADLLAAAAAAAVAVGLLIVGLGLFMLMRPTPGETR